MSRWYHTLAGRSDARLVDLGLGKLATAEGIFEIGGGRGQAAGTKERVLRYPYAPTY